MNRHRKILFALVFCALALFASHKEASAACGVLPNVFTNNVSIVDAVTTNANNNFLLACVKNVDNTQIGSAGIFASQVLCTTVATCSFGDTVPMTIAQGLTISAGGLAVDAGGATITGSTTITGATTITGSTTINGALTLSTPLPTGSGGTGASSFTSGQCIQYNGTTLASSGSSCAPATIYNNDTNALDTGAKLVFGSCTFAGSTSQCLSTFGTNVPLPTGNTPPSEWYCGVGSDGQFDSQGQYAVALITAGSPINAAYVHVNAYSTSGTPGTSVSWTPANGAKVHYWCIYH